MPLPPLPNLATESDAPAAPLRVAFLRHYAELYGANLSLLNLIEGLGGHAVHAHVIVPEAGDLLPELAQRGVPAAVFPFHLRGRHGRLARATSRKARLSELLLENQGPWQLPAHKGGVNSMEPSERPPSCGRRALRCFDLM